MSTYQHLLVGLDLTSQSPTVLHKALSLAKAGDAKVSIVHVLEPLTFAYGGEMPVDLSQLQHQLHKKAEHALMHIVQQHSITINHHVCIGQASTELPILAKHINADLIVIGSHGQKGLATLFGSTSNGILQNTVCDVLTVHIKQTR